MTTYRIVYRLWRYEARSKEECLKELAEMFKKHPTSFFTVEEHFDDRRPLWRRLLLG